MAVEPPLFMAKYQNMHRVKVIFALLLMAANGYGQHFSTFKNSSKINMGDVVINEIMADPDPAAFGIAYPEYVELYNKKGMAVNLKNWKFCVGNTCKTLPDAFIPSDSFIVLTAPASKSVFPVEVNAIGISGFPALNNTGQILQIQNETGNSISGISYTDEWYQDVIKKEGGYSLEQVDANNPCGEKQNWKASLNKTGGTPGKRNSVAGHNPDTSPPELLRVNILSTEQLEVSFTESLDSSTLSDLGLYLINHIGHPVKVELSKPHYKSIILYLGIPLKEGIQYTLTVEGKLTDCVGNPIPKNSHIRFALPAEIAKDDIVINEVLFDPEPGGVDFIEIYNASQKVVDLKSLFICHYDTLSGFVSDIVKITTSMYLLFPGEYLVLTEDAQAVKKQYHTENPSAFLSIADLPALNADEGNICLKTTTALIDHFTYNVNMHFALIKETKGISLERTNFRRFTNDVTNWHSASSAVGFATPGFKNSQFVDDWITEEEVSVNPEIFSPNGDGSNDQVNIHYHFDQPEWSITILIFDSKGRPVKTLVNNELIGSEGVYSWDGINDNREKEQSGIYIIYMKVFNLSGTIKQYKKVCVLSGKP